MEPAETLRRRRSEIVEEWARTMKGWEDTGYSRRPLEELRGTTGECFEGYLEYIERGSAGKLDAFIQKILTRRAELGFHLHHVMRAFGAFLPLAIEFLEREGGTGFQRTVFEPVEYALAASAAQYHQAGESELLTAVQQLAATMAAKPGDLQAVVDKALEGAAHLTGSQYGYLDLLDAKGQRLRCSIIGLKPEECALFGKARRHVVGRGLFGKITAGRRPLVVNSLAEEGPA